MNRKKTTLTGFILLLSVGIILSYIVETPYKVQAKGIIMAGSEFTLNRTIDGILVSTFKDNLLNVVYDYDVTEFQRGDVVLFRINKDIVGERYVNKGDTLGTVISNEEQRNLIDFQGQLEVLKAELEFFTTGQKPEDVLLAKEAWDLAKQELETQKKLIKRTEVLINDGVISEQEYDIEYNVFKVKEMEEKIARANFLSVTTGDKPEQVKLIASRMNAVQMQIDQIKSRITAFTITAPISGRLYFPRTLPEVGTLLTVVDTVRMVGVSPVLAGEFPFLKEGYLASHENLIGVVSQVDDMQQLIDFRQAFLVTTTWPYDEDLKIGGTIELTLHCDTIKAIDYLWRKFSNDSGLRS